MERERLSSAVEKQLECPVCLLKFRTPKLLECMHTFCEECLIHVSRHSRLGGVCIRCPTCRQKTKVTDVTKLHNNFIVQGIIDSMALAEQKDVDIESGKIVTTNTDEIKNHELRHVDSENENGNLSSSSSLDLMEINDCVDQEDGTTGSYQIGVNSRSYEITNFPLPASRESALNTAFNFTPSFNFGELDKTSFATPKTTVNSTRAKSYDFSVFNSAPSFSFGSLDKTSFSVLGTNADNIFSNCNERLFSTSNTRKSRSSAPGCMTSTIDSDINVNTCPSYSWGSLEKTSFA